MELVHQVNEEKERERERGIFGLSVKKVSKPNPVFFTFLGKMKKK